MTYIVTFELALWEKYKVVVEEISHLLYKLLAKLHINLEKHMNAHTVIAQSMW